LFHTSYLSKWPFGELLVCSWRTYFVNLNPTKKKKRKKKEKRKERKEKKRKKRKEKEKKKS
jgi:hypothetical protein